MNNKISKGLHIIPIAICFLLWVDVQDALKYFESQLWQYYKDFSEHGLSWLCQKKRRRSQRVTKKLETFLTLQKTNTSGSDQEKFGTNSLINPNNNN